MARAAARGDLRPTLITLAIGAILLVWAAYAFSGAGTLPRLPLLRTGLVVITVIYLLRALVFVPLHFWRPQHSDSFAIWSSLIVQSEEHTSELQSLMRISYAVFCLKKKTYNQKPHKGQLHQSTVL